MKPRIIHTEAEKKLDWIALTEALAAGHDLPRAEISDTFLYRSPDTLLSRAAWIDGMGIAVKSATVFPANPDRGLPLARGAVSIFSDTDGALEAILDFALVTKWKTAGDSLLGALRLARPDSRIILIVGAGTVAASLREAYGAGFPDAEFLSRSNPTPFASAPIDSNNPPTSIAMQTRKRSLAWPRVAIIRPISAKTRLRFTGPCAVTPRCSTYPRSPGKSKGPMRSHFWKAFSPDASIR